MNVIVTRGCHTVTSGVVATFGRRLLHCVVGLVVCGLGITLLLNADLGAAPWDVLHQGISRHLGWSVGVVIMAVGALLLLLWIPLRERPGLGTVLNALLIGATVDVIEPRLVVPDHVAARLGAVVLGVVAFGVGSGIYIGAGLGPGPRDGLMTGLARRGISIRVARTAIEVAVVVGGLALGGRVGVGTAAFALGIGPVVQWCLPRLTLPPRAARRLPATTPGVASSG